jgi:lysophospholipase L1-like esterase
MGSGKKFLGNILVLVIVLLVMTAGFEIVLHLGYPLYDNFNTEMWRYSTEIKKPSNLVGVSHEHQPYKESVLYGVNVRTNSFGFRDQELLLPKPPGMKRILLLGDSVTLGWGVDVNEGYADVLEAKLNSGGKRQYEVINTAVGNYNTQMEVDILEKYLFLEPDIVLVGFFPNDAEKTIKVKQDLAYQLKSRFYMYPFLWDRYTKLKFALASDKYTSRIHDFYTEEYGGGESVRVAFDKLEGISNEYNLPVYIVIIPQFYSEFENYNSAYIHEFVMDLCVEHGFVCIDTFEKFKEYELSQIVISAEDAHPNALGHEVIAMSIAEEIGDGI